MTPREIKIGSGLSVERLREARTRLERVERKVRSAGQAAIGAASGAASEIIPASLRTPGRVARDVSSLMARQQDFPITPAVDMPQEASHVLDFPAPTSPDVLEADITLVDAA